MIGDARAHVAAAITAGGVPCSAYPPATITPPTALLYADDPYVAPTGLAASTVGLRVRVVVASASGDESSRGMDNLIGATLAALHAAGIRVGPTPAPTVEDTAGVLQTDIPVAVAWED